MKTAAADNTAVAIGILGTVGLHRALFATHFDSIPGDAGDARVFVYLAEHWYHAFLGQAHLRSPGMFFPVPDTLGYTDPVPAVALPFSLFRGVGLDMFSAFAAVAVLFNLLNYLACYFLLRRVLRLGAAAACAGAMFFAFNSPRFSHAGHYDLQFAYFLPLTVALVVRVVRERSQLTGRQAFLLLAAAALSLNLQLLTSIHLAWFFCVWSVLAAGVALFHATTRALIRDVGARFWPALVGATMVFALGLWPVYWLYAPVVRSVGRRPWALVSPLIPDGWSILQMGRDNYVWGDTAAALLRWHRFSSTEHNIGIGLVASIAWIGLSVWALVHFSRASRARSHERMLVDAVLRVAILATTLFYVIGMKYWNELSPWQLVYRVVPGATELRAVSRYVITLALPMAIVFAVFIQRGFDEIAAAPRARHRWALNAALLAIVLFGVVEQFGRAPAFSKHEQLSRLTRLAATLPPDCDSFYVAAARDRPPTHYEYQVDAMLVSVIRGVPTLNGYSSFVPPSWSLREVEAPDYEQQVEAWIARHHVTGRICRLEIGG